MDKDLTVSKNAADSETINENDMSSDLTRFFYPRTICIAGASTKEKSIGYELLKTILSYNYTGKIFPVNPRAEEILGIKCYPSIEEIKEEIDLAIVVVPKAFVEDSIDSLLEQGVKSIILITAGFREAGSQGGEMEERILRKVRLAGARLVGPNCMGLINTSAATRLNATFVAEKPAEGVTGFLSQSGALGAAVLNSLRETDIKFAHFISVGNKADVNENDVLRYWEKDDNIKIITLYLESFVKGEEFLEPFINGTITKPVIVLKAGKTSGGMKAASSHTGALGSSDKVVDAVLNQFGIIRVNDINEMFNTARALEYFPLPHGNRIAVVTNAGGPAILAVDSLEKEGLLLAQFSQETREKLRAIVHPEGSIENPVDLLPGGTAEQYREVNRIITEDSQVDAVISIFVEPVMVQPFEVVEAVNSIETDKPIIQVDMPLPEFWDYYRKKSEQGKPVFRNPEDPAEVISNMLFYRSRKGRIIRSLETRLLKKDEKSRYQFAPGFLSQQEIAQIANDYDLPVIKNILISSDRLGETGTEFFPAVLKGISRSVIHKSEFNAVKLNISDIEELKNSADEMTRDFNARGFEIENFLIQPYVRIKHELLLGGFRDPSFGPMIMFGTGGKYVEIYNDTVIKSAYVSDADINEMIKKTKIGQILKGVRGEKPADIARLRMVIKNCARMMVENQNIREFDINPLVISEAGSIYAVDIRININEWK